VLVRNAENAKLKPVLRKLYSIMIIKVVGPALVADRDGCLGRIPMYHDVLTELGILPSLRRFSQEQVLPISIMLQYS
jgi:hypothetical protein